MPETDNCGLLRQCLPGASPQATQSFKNRIHRGQNVRLGTPDDGHRPLFWSRLRYQRSVASAARSDAPTATARRMCAASSGLNWVSRAAAG